MSEYATVAAGGMEVSSNTESAAEMIEALKKPDPSPAEPVEVKDGKPIEAKPSPQERGKKGGEATAAIRRREARDADEKPEPKVEAKPEEKVSLEAKDEPEEPTEGKPRKDPEARIGMLARQRREAEDRAARLEQELQAERASKAKPAEPEEKPQPKAPAKPDPRNFETYEQYLDARDDWNRSEWTRQSREAESRKAYGDYIGKTLEDFGKRVGEDGGDIEAFAAPSFMLPNGQRPTALNAAMDEIILSEHPRALIEHFNGNESELKRIAALGTPRDVAREIAKLEARLAHGSDAATTGTSSRTDVSQARPPVTPVSGPPHTSGPDITDPKLDFDEFVRRKDIRRASR